MKYKKFFNKRNYLKLRNKEIYNHEEDKADNTLIKLEVSKESEEKKETEVPKEKEDEIYFDQ